MGDFYTDTIQLLKEQDLEKDELVELKKDIAKKHGLKEVPSDIQILTHALALPRFHAQSPSKGVEKVISHE